MVDMAAVEHDGHPRKFCRKIIFPSYSTWVSTWGGTKSPCILLGAGAHLTVLVLLHCWEPHCFSSTSSVAFWPPSYPWLWSFLFGYPSHHKTSPKPLKKNQKETRVHCLFTPHCEGEKPPPSAADALCRHLFIVEFPSGFARFLSPWKTRTLPYTLTEFQSLEQINFPKSAWALV